MIKYEETHTKVIPKAKFNLLLGLINCHKKGVPKSKMGYAEIPLVLLIMVNQMIVIEIKYRYGTNL